MVRGLGDFKSVEDFKAFFEPNYKLEDENAMEAIYSPFRIEFNLFDISDCNCEYAMFDFEYEQTKKSYVKNGNRLDFYKNIFCDTTVDLSWMGL